MICNADDIECGAFDMAGQLNAALILINQWSKRNGLKLKVKKVKYSEKLREEENLGKTQHHTKR